MKPYMIIEGSNQALEAFEQKVASAIEKGYSLGGELVTHAGSAAEVKFFQSMIYEDFESEEEDFEDEDEEDEEDEDEY